MGLLVVETERCVGCQGCMFACARKNGFAGLENSCIFVCSVGGMERGFTVVVCRACADPPCLRVCPTNALKRRDEGGVILSPDKCIGCGNCQEACLVGAVQIDPRTSKPSICIHCGYCAKFCPHGVLEYRQGGKDTHAAQ